MASEAERDRRILAPYNPWWEGRGLGDLRVPAFRRPVFERVREDLDRIRQIISLTGPRRVGKTTIVRQLISDLLLAGVAAGRITYYSLDDPALSREGVEGGALIERIMQRAAREKAGGLHYVFLDEIQRLDRWELHLKKYYDLDYPVRLVISGSASSPIFKKSRESLLGRVKDYHILPFSFREFVLCRFGDRPGVADQTEACRTFGEGFHDLLARAPSGPPVPLPLPLPEPGVRAALDEAMDRYFLEGGFPEVWELPSWVEKQDYLFDNQVKKVIYEDLVLAAEFRKPELLKRFYISLLERPGREVSIQAVAQEAGIGAQQIEKYLPLLEMTDLVYRLERFRRSPLRVRRGRMKFYLVDLALRNAVLRLTETLLQDPAALGLYAENLVFLALRGWRGAIQLDYYRERDEEVDFVVHVGEGRYLPIEVKYRESIRPADLSPIHAFMRRQGGAAHPIVVGKKWSDFGGPEVTRLPLPMFLLLFD